MSSHSASARTLDDINDRDERRSHGTRAQSLRSASTGAAATAVASLGIHPVDLRCPNELCDGRRRVPNRQLVEQKREFFVVRRSELCRHVLGQIPQLLLERPKRLLARLVEELFVGVGRLSLVLRVDRQPLIDLRRAKIDGR